MDKKFETTNRGFKIDHFEDDYGVDCSIQESSSWEPHLWLGVHDPKISIMYKDAKESGLLEKLDLKKDCPVTNEYGWCTINLPKEVFIESRMHLNKKQAKELARLLNYFAKNGCLPKE